MACKRIANQQIACVLRQAENGATVDNCSENGRVRADCLHMN